MPILEIDFSTIPTVPITADKQAADLACELAEAARRQQPFLQMADGYQPGAVVSSSWGYDQTNIDFYLIEKRSGLWLTLIPLQDHLASDPAAFMTGKRSPLTTPKEIADAFTHDVAWGNKNKKDANPSFRRRLCFRDGKPIGFTVVHGWCSLWNGKPVNCSWYA